MTHQPLAYLNEEFLETAEARPIRILSEYLEPLQRFKEQKIQDTVVFFGSARFRKQSPARAYELAGPTTLESSRPACHNNPTWTRA